MKNIVKYIACSLSAFFMTACGDMYDIHEKYLKMGEETYIGTVQDLSVYSGFNRVKLEWYLNADPRISSCVITWEGGEKPVEVPVPADRVVKEPMSTIIELREGKYIFNMITRSDTGKKSLVRTIAGEVYGAIYQAGLSAQGINSMSADLTGVTINWIPVEGCTGTTLTYTNDEGEEKSIAVDEGQTSTVISDAVLKTSFKLVSRFKPTDDSFDDIPTLEKVMDFPAYYTISKEDWEVVHEQYTDADRTDWSISASTEEKVGENNGKYGIATCMLDGDLASFWHSQWDGEGAYPPLPHEIIIDMKSQQDILSIELARRLNNGDIKTVIFSIGNKEDSWTELGQLNFSSNKAINAQTLLLPEPVRGRYIRVLITGSNNGVNASIAEILFTTNKK